jgi:hypothetical protein
MLQRDPVAVHPPSGSKSLEHQEVKCALEAVISVLMHGLL